MSTPYDLTRLTLGDVLERTLTLIRLTFGRIGLIFVFLALPAALLFGVVMDGFLSTFFEAASRDLTPFSTPEFVAVFVKWLVLLMLAAVLMVLAELFALVSMQIIVCGEIVGRRVSVAEAVELTSGMRLWRAVGQRLLADLATALILVVPYLAVVGAVISNTGAISVLAAVLAVVAAICCAIYVRVRWAFGTTTIAWEDETVLGAFGRSSELVRGEWPRTFAILALFAIVVGLFVSMLLSPLQILMFKDIFVASLNQARNVALQSQPQLLEALTGIGFLYGITIAVSSLATTLIKSAYLSVLYFDLRARHGEFERE